MGKILETFERGTASALACFRHATPTERARFLDRQEAVRENLRESEKLLERMRRNAPRQT